MGELMTKQWSIKNLCADYARIARENNISEIMARLIINRGITEENINEYLNPDYNAFYSPLLMKDMKIARDFLLSDIKSGKKIRIIGDYDVDGVISTYILYSALLDLGAKVDYRIPERIKDGYGINIQLIDIAKADGIDTILTCDNGISAFEQVAYARNNGIKMIITDHHDLPEKIPEAEAVVNMKQKDCQYPYKNLCGAAVSMKLVEALHSEKESNSIINRYLEYAAIATICDVVELSGENRAIVKLGLEKLAKTKNLGLLTLMKACGIEVSQISAYNIGFVIGPCINASGRLKTADRGVELLMQDNPVEAGIIANELKELNDTRKKMTSEGLLEACEKIESPEYASDKVLVVYLDNCHESIAGIIAGRIREKYYKPTIVLTSAENGVKGSARSIPEYNIFEELVRCKNYLNKFGGHPLAAGMSLEYDNISAFRWAINNNCRLNENDLLPKVMVDIQMSFKYITEELVNELDMLAPFGTGNSKPVFAEKNIEILSLKYIGKTTRYIKMRVRDSYGCEIDALYFGNAEDMEHDIITVYGKEKTDGLFRGIPAGVIITLAYYPTINEYMGKKTLQINITDYCV